MNPDPKHTNTDPLDSVLQEMFNSVRPNESLSKAKQAINNYINSRVQQQVANELKYVFVTSKKELYWQSQTSLAKPLKDRIAELNQVKGKQS